MADSTLRKGEQCICGGSGLVKTPDKQYVDCLDCDVAEKRNSANPAHQRADHMKPIQGSEAL